MKSRKWKIPNVFDGDTSAFESAHISRLLSALMLARGFDTPESARDFLYYDVNALPDPFGLFDMDKAVGRIELALDKKETVTVFGDYDVDGITASCLLCDYLRSRGLDCRIYIPDRIDEGYGLNYEALESLKDGGTSLIITVDCGITAAADVERAKDIGLDLIITDHHECPAQLPDCCAVVNPRRHESGHPAFNLAGVGVSFMLVCALDGGTTSPLARYGDLAAVGTVADVMPLTGPNRIIVSEGLKKLRSNPRPGFAALLSEAGGTKPITSTVVGFTLAPRINAAGRLCQTDASVGLLMSENERSAGEFAVRLCELNRRRQELELGVWQDSEDMLKGEPLTGPIVLASESWHSGVVGIAASRLAEAYRLPAIMICLDGEEGKGSCRSYGSFNLFDALSACREHLESFGGHAFAAGINIKKSKIDDFRKALAAYYAETAPESPDELSPELQLRNFSGLTMEDVASLDQLEPCGRENPKPLICVRDVVIESLSEIGGGKHLRVNLSKASQTLDGVFFAQTLEQISMKQGEIADICFAPQINDFRSRKSVQLLLSGLRPSENAALCRKILGMEAFVLDESLQLHISRKSLGTLWRALRSSGGSVSLGTLFSDSATAALETCLGIRVFDELGLLEYDFTGDTIDYRLLESDVKASLEDSAVYRRVSAESSAE